jgi:hypothetical protein
MAEIISLDEFKEMMHIAELHNMVHGTNLSAYEFWELGNGSETKHKTPEQDPQDVRPNQGR